MAYIYQIKMIDVNHFSGHLTKKNTKLVLVGRIMAFVDALDIEFLLKYDIKVSKPKSLPFEMLTEAFRYSIYRRMRQLL